MGCNAGCHSYYGEGMYYVRDNRLRSKQNINVYPNFDNAKWGLASATQIVSNIASIKTALQYSPVVSVIELPKDNSWASWNGLTIYEHSSSIMYIEDAVFGHVVVIVGYNDTDSCWIIRETRGSSWGNNGYGKVKYGSVWIDGAANFVGTVNSKFISKNSP